MEKTLQKLRRRPSQPPRGKTPRRRVRERAKIGAVVQSHVGPPHMARQRIQMGIHTIDPSTLQASPY